MFGENVTLSEIMVNFKIYKKEESMTQAMKDRLSQSGLIIMSSPVEFTIECSYGDKKIEIDIFGGPVSKIIPIPDGVNPEDVTTAVLIEPDGTIHHAATKIFKENGKLYAVVTSFSSGTYILVHNNVKFKDVENHWSKEYVNELGARQIVKGIGNDMFNPEEDITRAEMVVMIVRTLGIKASGGVYNSSEKFMDVEDGLWYSDAIYAAREYGIIKGYTDNTFRPMQKITREESMAMIARTMRLLGIETNITETEVQQYLQAFKDGEDFGAWSRKDAAYLIKHKIILGSGGKLMPHNNIKRGEAAAIILRMLRTAGLI